jgi:hypothetical protein
MHSRGPGMVFRKTTISNRDGGQRMSLMEMSV